MITVAETAAIMASAKAMGMTDAERLAAIDLIARDPAVGDIIVGSGVAERCAWPGAVRANLAGIAWRHFIASN